ncbi:Zinc finger, RING/FYVE/PHD-type [Artemisia annua]|uniref:Zinc finger, RING/FYVE/PHD-type n=1 Tax=Artemisia annua TaxID=35608 RepID=A0A2U1PR68_ARTAN|nr:Zinc finger, RING/FYVE/PHD-type [Artemisia annua]
MAGKIPGLECARRRRFPGSTRWSDSSIMLNSAFRSSRGRGFYDTHFTSTSLSQRRMIHQVDQDEKLEGAAQNAKERLDGKLRSHWQLDLNSSQERSRSASLVEEIGRKPSTSIIVGDLQTEVFDSKKCGSKRFSWCKMGLNWKSCDQYECVVCLEKFKVGDKLTRLPCAHRFHFKCMVPWLENRTICPCCRMSVFG